MSQRARSRRVDAEVDERPATGELLCPNPSAEPGIPLRCHTGPPVVELAEGAVLHLGLDPLGAAENR